MSELLVRGNTVTADSVEEQARRAVSAFRALQPTLTSYARILSGNKNVRVDMAATDNGSTDGERIFFRPPIALGDNTQHVRRLCDKRDERGLMKCRACAIREEVLVTIYHEIAHICFESFARTTVQDKRRAIEFAVKEAKGPWAEKIVERVKNATPAQTASYISLCSLINEYLPFLLNCMEDARVNRELFKARKGVKRMFAADVQKVFDEGYECADGKGGTVTKSWREAPLNSQAMIGVFAKASGYDQYNDWFHPKVVEALNDEQLTLLIRELDTVRSANGVYNLSFRVLARLRDLGYCGTPQDPDPQPEESDDQGEGEGQSGDSDSPSESVPDSSGPEGDASSDSSPDGTPDADEPVPDTDPIGDASDNGDASREEEAPESDSDPSQGTPEDNEGSVGGLDDDDTVDSSGSDGADDSESGTSSRPDEQGEVDETDNRKGDSGDASEDSSNNDSSASEGTPEASDQPDGDDISGERSSEGDPSSDQNGGDSSPSGSPSHGEVHDDSDSSPSEMDLSEREGSAEVGDGLPQEAGSEDVSADAPSDVGDTGESESSGTVADERGDASSADNSSGQSVYSDGPDAPDFDDGEDAGEDHSATPDLGDTRSNESKRDDSTETIDTGADDGYGGTRVIDENYVEPEMGTPDEVDPIIKKWGDHEEKPKSIDQQAAEKAENNAVDQAIIQSLYFTKPSSNIWGVREHFYGKPIVIGGALVSHGWVKRDPGQALKRGQGQLIDLDESILQPALMRLRRIFTDNKRGKLDTNRKSGRVNASVLGKRAWNHDNRLFAKKTQPGKKDYFVVMGMDISGSTTGKNLVLEKRAVFAKAELLDRLGIPFVILAHTGSKAGGAHCLDMYHIKDEHEPWNDKTKQRLVDLGPAAANLDGHALEFLTKVADKSRATDKIIMYYSDGKMPLENYVEELEILQREIKRCASKGYTLLGVGIRTDSPRAHGLDTVEVNGDDDLKKVVTHLESRLSATANRR